MCNSNHEGQRKMRDLNELHGSPASAEANDELTRPTSMDAGRSKAAAGSPLSDTACNPLAQAEETGKTPKTGNMAAV